MQLNAAAILAHVRDTPVANENVVSHGLPITIEHKRGTQHTLHDDKGKVVYKVHMHHSYGYIRNTKGRDGDEVDCFLGPMKNAKEVYIVHMKDMGPVPSEREDEDKCMIGFPSADAAKTAFLLHYPDTFYNGMTSLPLVVFKKRLKQAQLPHREKKIHGGGPGSGRHPVIGTRPSPEHLKTGLRIDYNKIVHKDASGRNLVSENGAKWRSPTTAEHFDIVKYRVGQIKSGASKVNKEWNKVINKPKCPHCHSKRFTLMPTDFETAKCKDCGKTYEINAKEGTHHV